MKWGGLLWGMSAAAARLAYLAHYNTVKISVLNPRWMPDDGENRIYVFWHAKSYLILPYCRGRQIALLTLTDWKNRFYDALCRQYGHRTAPVASEALSAMELRGLLDDGHSIGLAMDGPRGPAGHIRPGAFYLALATHRKIVAVDVHVNHSWRIRHRWDRYEIPRPGAEAVATLSDPIEVCEDNLDQAQQSVRAFLRHV